MEKLRITVEGKVYEVVVEKIDAEDHTDSATAPTTRTSAPAKAPKLAPAPQPTEAGPGEAASPLAGTVQAIEVKEGDTVAEGDLILTLEAMKMYTPINAAGSGTIGKIHVKPGDAVDEGQTLYSLS